MAALCVLIFFLGTMSGVCSASLSLAVTADTRRVMDLGVFPFSDNGKFTLTLDSLSLTEKDLEKTDGPIGFTLDQVPSSIFARQEKNYGKTEEVDKKLCFIEDTAVIPTNPPPNWRRLMPLQDALKNGTLSFPFKADFTITDPGLYALFFYNCKGYSKQGPATLVHVTYSVSVEMYNVDTAGNRNYLGVGYEPLVKVYVCFAFIYFGLVVLWIREWRKNTIYVHKIHYLMSMLIVFKMLTVFFLGMKYKARSSSSQVSAWDVFYYMFLTLKGLALFSVILLLGTGWSFLKPFLSDRDKKVLMLILPMQMIVNITIAVIDETSEGNANWTAWKDILHILDIVCCCCVLLPVVWSIKSLKEAADADGKAARNLQRLRQFRTFYIVVVAYIYFTRIGVVLLENALPYTIAWVAAFVHECGSICFYTYVGVKFRPQEHSPYTQIPDDDAEELQAREELGAP
eukprot:PhF_6_TR40710/c0_g1_i1/m.61213